MTNTLPGRVVVPRVSIAPRGAGAERCSTRAAATRTTRTRKEPWDVTPCPSHPTTADPSAPLRSPSRPTVLHLPQTPPPRSPAPGAALRRRSGRPHPPRPLPTRRTVRPRRVAAADPLMRGAPPSLRPPGRSRTPCPRSGRRDPSARTSRPPRCRRRSWRQWSRPPRRSTRARQPSRRRRASRTGLRAVHAPSVPSRRGPQPSCRTGSGPPGRSGRSARRTFGTSVGPRPCSALRCSSPRRSRSPRA